MIDLVLLWGFGWSDVETVLRDWDWRRCRNFRVIVGGRLFLLLPKLLLLLNIEKGQFSSLLLDTATRHVLLHLILPASTVANHHFYLLSRRRRSQEKSLSCSLILQLLLDIIELSWLMTESILFLLLRVDYRGIEGYLLFINRRRGIIGLCR